MNGLKLFFHNAKYTMLSMFRLKVTLFWTLAFAFVLLRREKYASI